MNLRSIGAIVCLTAAVLLSSACGGNAPAEDETQPGQSATDPRVELEAALEKSAAENTSRTVIETADVSMTTDLDRSAEVMHSIGSIESTNISLKTESIVIDGARYWRTDDTDVENTKWTRSDLGTAASVYFGQSMFTPGDFLTEASKVALESPGRYRVEAAGDAKGLFGAAEGMTAEAGQVMTLTLDGQGRVGKIEVETPDGIATVTIEFGIEVQVTAPSADEIEKS